MKVVVLSNDFRVYWKGRLTFLRSFLLEKKIELYAVELFGKGSPYAFDTYNNTNTWWACLFPNSEARELSKTSIESSLNDMLDNICPDIVIASPITFFAGALGLRWVKHNRKKIVFFDDAKPLSQFKRNFLVRAVRDMLTKQADALWLPSKDYDNAYPKLSKKDIVFFYGYNCVDNDRFKRDEVNAIDHHVIICVARLVPIKNIKRLLRAWKLVEQTDTKYRLLIIGDGPDKEDLLKLSLEVALKRVTFSGAISNEEISDYYDSSDALVLPSLSETWGLVINEAMASGLPVLLSNRVNAAQTLLNEGYNGFSFDPFNVADIAETLISYIRLSSSQKRSMSAQSIQIINNMSYEQMGIQLADALPKIMYKKFRRPGTLAAAAITLWDGKHDTSAWDKLSV